MCDRTGVEKAEGSELNVANVPRNYQLTETVFIRDEINKTIRFTLLNFQKNSPSDACQLLHANSYDQLSGT
jgi:hypothetical protein